MTFLNHPTILETMFKATDNELSLRDVYKFMRPVFGSGVVYDADSTERMMEQVKFVSSGLTTARFRVFVDIFEDEVQRKVKELGPEGTCNVCELLADLIIFTASRCLLGDEVRQYLSEKNLGKLYHDLDDGISPLSFFFPGLPATKRDRARKAIGEIFQELLDKRREEHKKNPERTYEESKMDVVDHLLMEKYKDGKELTDEHRIGILIAGLFAGQHTSSITSSWTLMNVIKNPKILEAVRKEQAEIVGDAKLNYDHVMQMEYLEACMKEALRMYPPLIMIMRNARKPRQCEEYVIPKNNILVVSPSVAGRCTDVYTNPNTFEPERFLGDRKEHEKLKYGSIPFGAGAYCNHISCY